MGRLILTILFLALNLSCSQHTIIQDSSADLSNHVFEAKVIRIIDGDTMEILFENIPVKIRLAHIDCPEKRGSQPFGNNAKLALSDLCFGQQVTINAENYDRYGRLIAVIINHQNQIVNQELVKKGLAWHFKQYSTDKVYAELEIEARNRKIGIWADKNPIPPWEWRGAAHNKL